MTDEFFIRALLAGAGVALVAGPLGCFVVWRRLAYFGATIAHSALLGVVLALLLEIHITAGVFAIAVLGTFAALAPARSPYLPSDTLLGIAAHGALALGLVLIAWIPPVRVDLMGYLFGDILSVSWWDIAIIYGGGAAVLAALVAMWRPLLAATVSEELAAAEGMRPERTRLLLLILMASTIAIAMKIVGILLITSLLIIPAAAARRLSRGPEAMAAYAALIGLVASFAGMFGSLRWNVAAGPAIVVAAAALFLASVIVPRAARRRATPP